MTKDLAEFQAQWQRRHIGRPPVNILDLLGINIILDLLEAPPN